MEFGGETVREIRSATDPVRHKPTVDFAGRNRLGNTKNQKTEIGIVVENSEA